MLRLIVSFIFFVIVVAAVCLLVFDILAWRKKRVKNPNLPAIPPRAKWQLYIGGAMVVCIPAILVLTKDSKTSQSIPYLFGTFVAYAIVVILMVLSLWGVYRIVMWALGATDGHSDKDEPLDSYMK